VKPFVSILIPAYNSQKWIAESIESSLTQSWERKEIIVVDDGSRDRTLEVARRYESKNVRVVTQVNQGAATARNAAFSLAQGDYIQWLDADDVMDSHKIESQVNKLADGLSKRVLLSGAWGHFIYRKRKARFVPSLLWHDLSPVEWLLRKMGSNLHMQTATWLVSREITEAAGPWNTQLSTDDDGEYFCRILMQSESVRFVPESKVYYRACGTSSLSYVGSSDKKIESLFLSMKLHMQYLRSLEDSERTRAACISYIRTWLPEICLYRMDIAQQLQQLCIELGGEAKAPRLPRKYRWLERTVGWHMGRKAELTLQATRANLNVALDKAMQRWENWTGVTAEPPDAASHELTTVR
jgi:hypothetical protein